MKKDALKILEMVKNGELTPQIAQEQLFVLFGVSDSTHYLIYFEKERYADHKPFIVKRGHSNAQVLKMIQDKHGEIFRWWYCR